MIPAVGRHRGSVPPIAMLNLANLVDASGNGKSLMVGGSHTPTFASDPFGIGQDALIFDGAMQAAAYGPDWTPPLGAFTYQFRIKRDVSKLAITQYLFGRWATISSARNFQYLCYFDNANNLNFIITETPSVSSYATVTVGAITDGNSHAVEFALSAGTLYAYLDGVLIQTAAAVPINVPPDSVAMEFGTFGDSGGAPGGNPLYGVMGDFMLSDIARHTGASYVVSASPAAADSNTVSLLPMATVEGSYLETPVYQNNCLVRGSFAPASGGWSNPDGPLQQIGGGWYFTSTAWNGSQWTVWGITAPSLATLLAGGGTIGALAIQTPAGGEGTLAGNGSVVPFSGQYWHFYHDFDLNIKYSNGADLGAPFSPQPGNLLFTGFFDPFVRVSPDGTTLIMYMGAGTVSQRSWWKTTSTDGVTWATPVEIVPDVTQSGFTGAPGEFSTTDFPGVQQLGFSDGAPTGSTTRDVLGWGTADGSNWLPLFMRLTAAGTGSDAGGNPYIAVCDTCTTWDSTNHRLIIMCTHSTNTQPTEPTDADIGVWFANVEGL